MVTHISNITSMIDISAVRAESDQKEINNIVECAEKYHCIAVFVLPSQVEYTKTLLGNYPKTKIGSTIGFPSGGGTTKAKKYEAQELVDLGCDELDMVINIGMLKSGKFNYIYEEIKQIRDVVNNRVLKVILECCYLTEYEILKACDICINANADFVKTSTGWAKTGVSLENISLIKKHVGTRIKIKAAGGIRELETLLEMHKKGVTRFGVGLKSFINIFEKLES